MNNQILQNMVALWNRIAPYYQDAIKRYTGRTFRFRQILTDGDDMVRVDFAPSRKRKGAVVSDKVSVSCIYKPESDSYNLLVQSFDGVTFETVAGPMLRDMTVDLVIDNAEAVVRSLDSAE